MAALDEFERVYKKVCRDRAFRREFESILANYVGRPTALTEASKFAALSGDFKLFLKREDLSHTGAHKINNAVGQALIAKRMGKQRIIAETGAGQHGVATATACALLGLQCLFYMGEVDMARQELNVFRMRLLGAEVVPVSSGSRTLKDAINEAIRDWVTNVRTTHYIIGSVLGPHPYPMIGPQQAYLQKIGRIEYHDCSDDLALEAFHALSEREGIIPALESSHALGWLMRNGAAMTGIVVVNLSGRGDKDVPQVAALESR